MRTSFSWKQIEDCIVVIGPLVEQAKEGALDAFAGVSQYGAGGPKPVCRLEFGRKSLQEKMKHCHPSR